MPLTSYADRLQAAPPGAFDALADAAEAVGFPSDALLFAAAAGRPLPDPAHLADPQLRAWRTFVGGGPRHLFLFPTEAGHAGESRIGRLMEALTHLGHGAERLALAPLEAGQGAGLIHDLLAAHPGVEAVLLGYAADLAHRLAPLRHHLTVVYGAPSQPEEGFFARYLHRAPSGAPPAPTPARRPLFSIVIPTRNNAECLEHNLRTCLEQPFADFEIVIGDNSDPGDAATEALVRRLDSEKLRYFRTDRKLDLADNFEFTHARAQGEYLLGLGSDDGLLRHGLGALALALDQAGEPVEAMRFDFLYYGWPNSLVPRFRNFFRVPPSILKRPEGPQLTWLDSRDTLERYARFEIPFYDLPNGYGYSILSRRLLDRIIHATGRAFPGETQDAYTGVYALTQVDRFARLDFPITAFATSGASMGSQNAYNGPDRNRVRHYLDGPFLPERIPAALAKTDSEGRDPHYDPSTPPDAHTHDFMDVCRYYSDEVINAQTLVDAVNRKLLDRSYLTRVDWRRYFTLCAAYLYEGDPHLAGKLDELHRRARTKGDPALEAWVLDTYVRNPAFKGHPAPPPQDHFHYGLLPNGVLYLDGADFGLENVYDAVQLFEKLSHLQEPG